MPEVPLARRLAAEGIGSFLLFATVIGSGIMAENLAAGNEAIALWANTAATGAMLFVLITMFGPVSGAHFNPAVSLVAALDRNLTWRDAALYTLVQLAFGIAGAWAAHLMFELPALQLSVKARTGWGQWLGEGIATFGLILTILGTARHRPAWIPASVALYITAAYWFTSSTSFANPAITIARSLSDSFAGIAPNSVPAFIAAQLVGALAAARLLSPRRERPSPLRRCRDPSRYKSPCHPPSRRSISRAVDVRRGVANRNLAASQQWTLGCLWLPGSK